jgi:hypothetical protein
MSSRSESGGGKPEYVASLEAAYGTPSQTGFGSVVFHAEIGPADDLEQTALEAYRRFVGGNWERFGAAAWLSGWKRVYARMAGSTRDIVAELRSIADPGARLSVPMILDVVENAEAARHALSAAYDDAAVADLEVYTVGDGAAMSGILIAGRRETGEATFVVFLMD